MKNEYDILTTKDWIKLLAEYNDDDLQHIEHNAASKDKFDIAIACREEIKRRNQPNKEPFFTWQKAKEQIFIFCVVWTLLDIIKYLTS